MSLFSVSGYDVNLDQALLIAATGGLAAAPIMMQQNAQMQVEQQEKAFKQAEKQAAQNQNALVKQTFEKRKQMAGLGDGWGLESPSGNQASQSGAILTSLGDVNAQSLLG